MGTNQQFSLRWNNYLNHITDAFDSLREDENLVDVTLCCEGRKIKAHRMLLSACSSYFRDIFKDNPCNHPVIVFHNVKYEDLLALVAFMYRGEVNVEQESLSSFLNTAELLEIQGLTSGTGRTEENEEEMKQDPVKTPRKQSSPKPYHRSDSPSAKKKKDSPPTSPPADVKPPFPIIKSEFDFFHRSSPDDQKDQGHHSLSKNESSFDNSYSDENTDAASDIGAHAGSSNELSNIPESLQVMPFNAWSNCFEDAFDGKCEDLSMRNEDMKMAEKKVFAHGLWRRLHPSLKRFGCDECGKVFKHPRSLDHHKKMHEGRTTCPFCRRVFGRMYALRLHMTSSHPGLPLLPSRHSTKSH